MNYCGYHAWSLYVHTLKSHDCFTHVLTGDLLHVVINKITHKKACVAIGDGQQTSSCVAGLCQRSPIS